MSTNVARVVVATDRQAFADAWRAVATPHGLATDLVTPSSLAERVGDAATVSIDAGWSGYNDDEQLLAAVGFARARGAEVAVVMPGPNAFTRIDDLLRMLCRGRVAREANELSAVAASLARAVDAARVERFEYVSLAPKGDAFLTVYGDGHAVLVPRPATTDDDRTAVSSINLEANGTRARITLASGKSFELTPRRTNGRNGVTTSNGTQSSPAIDLAALDGVRVGKRIRELRVAAGLTQAELARRTGIHRPNIARVEAGRHSPSLETLGRLAAAIGVAPATLLADA